MDVNCAIWLTVAGDRGLCETLESRRAVGDWFGFRELSNLFPLVGCNSLRNHPFTLEDRRREQKFRIS